jgi:hypothetical protein
MRHLDRIDGLDEGACGQYGHVRAKTVAARISLHLERCNRCRQKQQLPRVSNAIQRNIETLQSCELLYSLQASQHIAAQIQTPANASISILSRSNFRCYDLQFRYDSDRAPSLPTSSMVLTSLPATFMASLRGCRLTCGRTLVRNDSKDSIIHRHITAALATTNGYLHLYMSLLGVYSAFCQ